MVSLVSEIAVRTGLSERLEFGLHLVHGHLQLGSFGLMVGHLVGLHWHWIRLRFPLLLTWVGFDGIAFIFRLHVVLILRNVIAAFQGGRKLSLALDFPNDALDDWKF